MARSRPTQGQEMDLLPLGKEAHPEPGAAKPACLPAPRGSVRAGLCERLCAVSGKGRRVLQKLCFFGKCDCKECLTSP